MLALFFTCPKRKCRHTWTKTGDAVANSSCPKCGTDNVCPVDIERTENDENSAFL